MLKLNRTIAIRKGNGMEITEEDYKKAKDEIALLRSWIERSNDRIGKLLDEITAERRTIKLYENSIKQHNETILRYEAINGLDESN